MLFTEVGVRIVSGRGVGGQHRIELLEEAERERTIPIVAFDYSFTTQENADTFPILICRDSRFGQTEATFVKGKVPLHISFHSWSVSSKILFLAESF